MTKDNPLLPEGAERGQVTLGSVLGSFDNRSVSRLCEKHGEYTAAVMTIGGREITSFCPTCAEESKVREVAGAMAELQEHRAQIKRQRLTGLIESAGIPARFRQCTFDGFTVDTGASYERQQVSALRICRAFVDRWESVKAKGQALVLTGPTGTGKTHLACAIANGLMERHMASVAFGTVSEHVRAVKATFAKDSEVTDKQIVRALIDADLLVLDELGQRTTEYDQQLIFDVVNGRYAEMRPMVLMSNLSAMELEQVLGDRLTDRLHEIGVFLPMDWPSHRSRGR